MSTERFSPGQKLELCRELRLGLDVARAGQQLQVIAEFFANLKLEAQCCCCSGGHY